MEFPILAWSAHLKENCFTVLDETQLPEKVICVTVTNYSEAVEVIRTMKTRAFGQLLTVFYALVLTARHSSITNLRENIETAAETLRTSRPTFAFGKYTDLVICWTNSALNENMHNPSQFVEQKILELLENIKMIRIKRAELAASILMDGDTILTHCNTSGELLLTARICREQGKKLTFYATETRPYLQGRLTSWEMSQEGFPITLIRDNQTSELLASGKITKVITGSDRVALNGDIVNKVGTFQIALLAQKYRVPYYAFVQEPGKTATGADVTIEQRDAVEVRKREGVPVYPESAEIYYPAFDMTPYNYITGLITFNSILHHSELPGGWNKTL